MILGSVLIDCVLYAGPNHNISIGLNESRSHFGAWATVSSPLIIGMDITNKTNLDSVWPFLSNPEAMWALPPQCRSVYSPPSLVSLGLL